MIQPVVVGIALIALSLSTPCVAGLFTIGIKDTVVDCPFGEQTPCGTEAMPGPVSVGTEILGSLVIDVQPGTGAQTFAAADILDYMFSLPEIGLFGQVVSATSNTQLTFDGGMVGGLLQGEFPIGPPGSPMAVISHDFNAGTWDLRIAGALVNAGTTVVTAVPEPLTFGMLLAGFGLLMGARRSGCGAT